MSRRARWIPALVAPALVAAGAVTIPVVADADPGLPEKSAQQVLELVAASETDQFSGTIEQTSELGLPDLPAGGGSEDAGGVVEALTQPHTVRVFVDGADRSRVQVMDQMAERDVIRNGEELWLWSSADSKAVHSTVPEHPDHGGQDRPEGVPATPPELAEQLLAAVDETTEVSVGGTATVADRPVYQLRLDPRTTDTLVDEATLSVDAETGMPLAVQLRAVGQQAPAFSVGFTSLELGAPDADLFDFTPPGDAQVFEETLPGGHEHTGKPAEPGEDTRGERPEVSGEGWASVVQLSTGGADAEAASDPMVQQLTVPVEGGRALQTSLLSVLLTDDGRVLAGAVPVDQLVAAAR